MPRTPISVTVSRGGVNLLASPFTVRRYIGSKWTGNSSQIAPNATKETSRATISFLAITSEIRVGDLVTFPTSEYGRVVNVRTYDRSLQCDVQIIPYFNVRLWTPTTAGSRATAAGDVKDVSYVNAGPILAYLDPLKDDLKVMAFGSLTEPVRYCYTLQTIAQKSMLVQASGVCWMAETASEDWQPANDLRCMVRRQERLPVGVTA